MSLQSIVQRVFHACGYHISRFDPNSCGENPFVDMAHFVTDGSDRMVFDVGANVGQFLDHLRLQYPKAAVHAFEPSPATFGKLSEKTARMANTSAWNFGLGANASKATLLENVHSSMSSMLELGSQGWGHIEKQTEIDVRTIDDFCDERSISRIDLLKSDTQGYDLEVFMGAERMMRENRIGLIYAEINFAEIYKNLPPYDEIFKFLRERGFVLVALYKMQFKRQVAGWADALFVSNQLLECTAR